jgi:small subunit ribosomal protein S21
MGKLQQPAWRKEETIRHQSQQSRESNDSTSSLSHVRPLEVSVFNGDVQQALRSLKRRMSEEGVLSALRRVRYAEKPSAKKRRKHREALKRLRKAEQIHNSKVLVSKKPRSDVVASIPISNKDVDFNAMYFDDESGE